MTHEAEWHPGWADETVLVIKRLDAPFEQADEATVVLFSGVALSEVDLVEMIKGGSEDPPDYSVDRQRNHTSWGAESAFEFVTLAVSSVIAQVAVERGIDALLRKYRRWQAHDPIEMPVNREVALSVAKQTLLRAYENEASDGLRVLSEEDAEGGAWNFMFEGQSHNYAVRVEWRGSVAWVTKLRRQVRK